MRTCDLRETCEMPEGHAGKCGQEWKPTHNPDLSGAPMHNTGRPV